MLLDNSPSGLRPGVDYLSVSSADNFGIGAIAAELTSPHVPNEGVVGILNYESEFFVTNEREIGFRKWMGAERPDATLVRSRFASVEEAGAAYERLLAMNDDLDCVFVAWDVPALRVLATIRDGARTLPIVTVDLGDEIAKELRKGGPLKGIAAQRPFDQGAAAATAALMGLVGRSPPGWITSEGLMVTRENLDPACDVLWCCGASLLLHRSNRGSSVDSGRKADAASTATVHLPLRMNELRKPSGVSGGTITSCGFDPFAAVVERPLFARGGRRRAVVGLRWPDSGLGPPNRMRARRPRRPATPCRPRRQPL